MKRRRRISQAKPRRGLRFDMRGLKNLQRYLTRKNLLIAGGGLLGIVLLVQLLYPADRLLPLTNIQGARLGGQAKSAATDNLNEAFRAHKVSLRMEHSDKEVAAPTIAEIGGTVDAAELVAAHTYPWHLRLVPTSLLWGQRAAPVEPAVTVSDKTDAYIADTLMKSCKQPAVNASLKASGAKLELVPARDGASCKQADIKQRLAEAKPHLAASTTVQFPSEAIKPEVSDAVAKQLADTINPKLAAGVPMTVGDTTQTVPGETVAAWLAFAADGATLAARVDAEKAVPYLGEEVAPKITQSPGVSKITTQDFTVVSREDGAPGRALDTAPTLASVQSYLLGEADTVQAVTKIVPPREEYTRTYSPTDTGLSALLENYAKDHPGTYGVSLIELDGKKRRAQYNGDKKFVTASTYKLFTAYSLLKRVDDGRESWDANAECFRQMISISENSCAEKYIHKFGFKPLTDDLKAIGLNNSNFIEAGGPFTTANDLALLLGQLQSGQNFSPSGRDRLLNAMRGNIHRQGIPAGVSGSVADKVGFLNGLYHDAAIVYSPHGTYVLVILSDGSSWATVADFARQIDGQLAR